MMKSLNKLILVGLLAIGGVLNAAQPPVDPNSIIAAYAVAIETTKAAAQAAPAASSSNDSSGIGFGQIALSAALGLGAWFGKDVYEWCKGKLNGESDKNTIDKEIDIESKKIALVQSEANSLNAQYQALVLLYNGGANTGLDKKEIQAEIKKVWDAMKINSSEAAVIIQTAKAKIKELEQKRSGIKANASTPKTLAQATQLPTATVQATPAMAAKMLAESKARAA